VRPVTIYGIHPVLEALKAGKVIEVRVGPRHDGRVREIVALAEERGVPVRHESNETLGRQAGGRVHQGVVAEVEGPVAYSVADLVRAAPRPVLLVVLDGIEDPHNMGAILRTAEAAGVDGVVIQRRRAAGRGGVVAKASAGAVARVRIADVVNVARAIDELKEAGVWTVGLAGEAHAPYHAVDFTVPTALVLGAEGAGLRRLVRERCDRLVAIPMHGQLTSLNVSVAAGVALFEAVRQRKGQARGSARPRID